jgi:hypothetical protein
VEPVRADWTLINDEYNMCAFVRVWTYDSCKMAAASGTLKKKSGVGNTRIQDEERHH